MTKSESIKELATALCAFQSNVEAITKDATNPFFKSKYASLSAIIEDTRELLAKNGLSYAQFPSKLGQSGQYVPALCTILMHTSGEWIEEDFPVSPVDNKPQSVGSAITYARRYALQSILGLQVEDDDGNAASQLKIENRPPQVVFAPKKPVEPLIDQVIRRNATRKAEIKKLVDAKVLEPLEQTAKAYEEYVLSQTGLKLEAQHYEAIIERLSA